jgi:hypothetical protein
MKVAFTGISVQSLRRYLVLFGTFIFLMLSCAPRIPGPSDAKAPVVIYKTRKDYRDYVTVQLSEDGSSVKAYPAPTDVLAQKPLELAGGYLLKRMLGNVYLSLTIEDYASSPDSYSPEELFDLVMDKDPYLEIYECSECSRGDTASLNQLIRQGKLKGCKPLL